MDRLYQTEKITTAICLQNKSGSKKPIHDDQLNCTSNFYWQIGQSVSKYLFYVHEQVEITKKL